MRATAGAVLLLAAALGCPSGASDFPFSSGRNGLGDVRLAAVASAYASLKWQDTSEGRVPELSFSIAEKERRLVALEAAVREKLFGIKTAKITYRLRMNEGARPRMMVAVFEKGGAMWFRVWSRPLTVGRRVQAVLPVGSMRLASFTRDETGQLEWGRVEKAWLGLVVNGPASGTVEVYRAEFSTDPYKAAEPLKIAVADAKKWNVGHDPRVKYSLTVAEEGPDGGKCVKVSFVFPVGRHMYLTPTLRIPECEMEGYSGVQFNYRAELPQGISGLLVTLAERDGSQYEAWPYPPPSQQWRTVTIPFAKFRPAGWTRDENGKLDLGQVASITIGAHGTARGDGGKGTVWISDLRLVP